eukprot:Tamp_23268.p1 GENE.Tamp_23268~~Tamp_23268.p1  ORF type:complete len:231 (-),score=33.50 Tamp_23268:351-1004(-)
MGRGKAAGGGQWLAAAANDNWDPAFQGHEAAPRRRWWACACLGGSSPADELDFDGEAAFRKAIALHGEHRSDNLSRKASLEGSHISLGSRFSRDLQRDFDEHSARQSRDSFRQSTDTDKNNPPTTADSSGPAPRFSSSSARRALAGAANVMPVLAEGTEKSGWSCGHWNLDSSIPRSQVGDAPICRTDSSSHTPSQGKSHFDDFLSYDEGDASHHLR